MNLYLHGLEPHIKLGDSICKTVIRFFRTGTG
jgi:hypothetical protein